jgi:hypothetical protein
MHCGVAIRWDITPNHKKPCATRAQGLFFRLAHDRAPPIFGETFAPNFFHPKKFLKKFFNFFPKVLDKLARLWYNKDTKTRAQTP